MVVLLNIEGKCARFRAKIAQVSGHLPALSINRRVKVASIPYAVKWDVYNGVNTL